MGQKWKKKKTALSGSVPTIFVWDCSYHYYTLQYYVKLQNSQIEEECPEMFLRELKIALQISCRTMNESG